MRIGCALWFILFSGMAMAQNTAKTVAERLGYPADSRLLVIHADDLGMSRSVDQATIEALEKHWVTSASIMVPCPWFPEVVEWAKSHHDADLGIHLTLNSEWSTLRWRGLTTLAGSSLLDAQGYLPATISEVVQKAKSSDVQMEARAQVERAREAGITLSHLDTHMGTIVSSPQFFGVYVGLGRSYGLPVLLEQRPDFMGVEFPREGIVTDRVLMMLPGPSKEQWLAAYEKMLAPLPPGSYQLIVHLGLDNDELRAASAGQDAYGSAWRQRDFDLVSSSEFQRFLKEQKFILVSWSQLAKAVPANWRQ
jgi:chitin disaccharide deacetylase